MTKKVLVSKNPAPLPAGAILFLGDSTSTDAYCVSGGYPIYAINTLNTRSGSTDWSEATPRMAVGGRNTWELSSNVDDWLANPERITPDYVFLYSGANDQYPNDGEGDYTPLGAGDEASWKAAYTHIAEAIHTKYPNAIQYINRPYRCMSNGVPDGFLPNFLFPWIDNLVATISYLNFGISGAAVLQAGFPESMGGHSVHQTCYGNQLLGEAIATDIFHVR